MTDQLRRSRLSLAVSNAAERLQNAYLQRGEKPGSEAAAKSTLSEMRRYAGRSPEKAPLAFQRVMNLMYPALLDEEPGLFATREEEAAFYALTLFASHMQSATQPVHVEGCSFARACGLMYTQSESESLKPCFDAILTAAGYESQLYHARSLVSILRSKNIGFDYGAFAQDLKTLRNPKFRNSVLLRWGRDFATAPFTKKTEK